MRNIIILGMHRSGTSFLSQLLASAGVYFGRPEELLAPQEDNPEGFFERTDVVACNDLMLGAAGSSWSNPFSGNKYNSPDESNSITLKAKAIIEKLHSPWGLKDPRMCLTLPLWEPVLGEAPVYVVVLRNPLAIAQSLYKRNKIPVDYALDLWAFYMARLQESLSGKNYVVVSFEGMREDLSSELTGLADVLIKSGMDKISGRLIDSSDTFNDELVHFRDMKAESVKEAAAISLHENLLTQGFDTPLANNWSFDVANISLAAFVSEAIEYRENAPLLKAQHEEREHLVAAYEKNKSELENLRRIYRELEHEKVSLTAAYKIDRAELQSLRMKYEKLDNHNTELSHAYHRDNHELKEVLSRNDTLESALLAIETSILKHGIYILTRPYIRTLMKSQDLLAYYEAVQQFQFNSNTED